MALAELTRRQSDLAADRDRLRTEVDDLSREQRKADADVEQVKARRTRNTERIDAGQVADPKQLQAMQHEVETLDRRIADLEDVELDVLERLEMAQTSLTAVEAELSTLDAEVAEAATAKDTATGELHEEQVAARQEREALVPAIPAPLMALYDKLRGQLDGVGVGAISHRRCSGCQLDIGAADMARMTAAPPDEVLRCENCNRILVRARESGI